MILTFLNESCLQWSFGDALDEATIRTTLAAFRKLNEFAAFRALGVLYICPAYNKFAALFSR